MSPLKMGLLEGTLFIFSPLCLFNLAFWFKENPKEKTTILGVPLLSPYHIDTLALVWRVIIEQVLQGLWLRSCPPSCWVPYKQHQQEERALTSTHGALAIQKSTSFRFCHDFGPSFWAFPTVPKPFVPSVASRPRCSAWTVPSKSCRCSGKRARRQLRRPASPAFGCERHCGFCCGAGFE